MKAEQLAIASINRNTMYKIQPSNNSAARQEQVVHPDKLKRQMGRDRVIISPMQRANNMLATLREQKENIVKAKGELAKYARETGKNYDDIKPQMENYDNLLKSLDEQIAAVYDEQNRQAVEQKDKPKEKKADAVSEDKTKEQLETERLTNLASATNSTKQSKTVANKKKQIEGEAAVKESEIALGELWIEQLEDKTRGNSGALVKYMISSTRRILSEEQKAVTNLREQSNKIDGLHAEKLRDTMSALEGPQGSDRNPPSEQELRDKATQKPEAAPNEAPES